MANSAKYRWDPNSYLRFEEYRSRPTAELVGRIHLESPSEIYDLGCGPGNSTNLLRQKWPDAKITGVDNSSNMLAKAKELEITARWQLEDISSWTPKTKPDVIFSNATLQWLNDHDELFLRLLGFLKPGGVLAVQMPNNFMSPSHTIIRQVVEDGPWSGRLTQLRNFNPVARPEDYFKMMTHSTDQIDIWETEYMQVLNGKDAVFLWLSATALLPFVSELQANERKDFLEQCKVKLGAVYQPRDNNVTLFPFRRLFIVAVAKH